MNLHLPMNPLNRLKEYIALDSPIRIFYHKIRSMLAAFLFGFPANRMIVIAVTGTDGKTTTCNMIVSILKESGYKVGLLSTVLCSIGDDTWMNETKMTSLDPFIMNDYLSKMKKTGCQYVVLEVSSHAILYQRIWGVNIDIAVMTHISSDHLDLHRTVKNYIETKKRLFTSLNYFSRKPHVPKVAILNNDDHYIHEFEEVVADKKYMYGINIPSQVYGMNIRCNTQQTLFTVRLANTTEDITIPLPGAFNVYNALAAIAVALSQNISLTVMKEAFMHFSGVPGRMERIDEGQPFSVIVDYAHTEDALKKVLSTLKPTVSGKLILVFGATGDRDRSKRPKMGEIAHQYANHIILTDDDPYSENNMHIIQEVSNGIHRQESHGFWIIPNRRQAIKTAIHIAHKGDLVLITGKGAEQVQVLQSGKIPWDDREITRQYIRSRYT
jgi:UDP-N-acetylmuramoyl-L-alanyl-D-glutamate--2,6-diaminopimelate ligase